MMQTGVTWRFTVTVTGASSAEADQLLDEHTDKLMDGLLDLEECNENMHDPSVGAELSTGTIDILMLVDAPVDDAVKISRDIVRTAIHAAGGWTPQWDDDRTVPMHTIEYEPQGTELAYA